MFRRTKLKKHDVSVKRYFDAIEYKHIFDDLLTLVSKNIGIGYIKRNKRKEKRVSFLEETIM